MSQEHGDFKSFAVRVARLPLRSRRTSADGERTEVWVHAFLIIFIILDLVGNHLSKPPIDHPSGRWIASAIGLLVAVLFHELGHLLAALREGGGAERIVLWPLGGLVFCEAPQEPASQFRVASAGPLASLLVVLVLGGISWAADWSPLPPSSYGESFPFLQATVQGAFLWSSFLLVLGWVPSFPSDAGRMLHALVWARTGSQGGSWLTALRVSRAFAVASLVMGLLIFVSGMSQEGFRIDHPLLSRLDFGLVLVALAHFVEGRAMTERLLHGGEDEGVFGYDFSRGYTSLERTATRQARRTSFLTAMQRRFAGRASAKKREREEEVNRRVDELLEKITRSGMESLTPAERRYLTRASKRLRK